MGIIKDRELQNIYYHTSFNKEVSKLLKGYSNRHDFLEWFSSRLILLDDPEYDELDNYKSFERLTDTPQPLYSLTYRHKEKNIRILYCKNDDRKVYLLSCAFDEKNKSDYQLAIGRALNRKLQWEVLL